MPRKPLKARNKKPDLAPWMIEYLKNGDIYRDNYTHAELEFIEWDLIDWEFGPFRGAAPMIRPHEAWAILKPKVNPRKYPWAYQKFENHKKD